MRLRTLLLTSGSVVLLAAAGVTHFAIYPAADQVPGNLNVNIAYIGTAVTPSTDGLTATPNRIPITATQHIQVLSTAGSTAVVEDAITIAAAHGKTLSKSSDIYAVNRVTLEPAQAPAGSDAESHQGLVVGFPISPQKTTYKYWDPTTRTTSQATYTGNATLDGRSAYGYTLTATGTVADPATLATLPKTLPKSALTALAPSLPAAQRTELEGVLPTLPSNIPLSYTSTTHTTAEVDAATGTVLSATESQTITADLDLGATRVPTAPVLTVTLATTPATAAIAAHDAATAATLLTLLSTTIPLTSAIVAILLAALAFWSSRRRSATVKTTPEQETQTA